MILGDPEVLLAGLSDRYDVVVLLVDDQPIIGEAVRRALCDNADIDLHFCSNPLDAVEVAEKIKPTVILQDLVMPGMDGLTLVRKYRTTEATKDIPIIVLSTDEDPEIKRDAFALGASDYLIKLPSAVELLARIRHHSKAYLNQLQRDAAYRALRESQQLLLEKNLELERLSNADGLTGLSNRRSFKDFMRTEWPRAIRDQQPLAILMIDVDDFKHYNDRYGHVAGDKVLRSVGEMIQDSCKRPTDLAVRFGGEEFLIYASGMQANRAAGFAERIRSRIEALAMPHAASAAASVVTISVGVAATTPGRGDSYLALVESADEAMYEAKHAGKNGVVFREHRPKSRRAGEHPDELVEDRPDEQAEERADGPPEERAAEAAQEPGDEPVETALT